MSKRMSKRNDSEFEFDSTEPLKMHRCFINDVIWRKDKKMFTFTDTDGKKWRGDYRRDKELLNQFLSWQNEFNSKSAKLTVFQYEFENWITSILD